VSKNRVVVLEKADGFYHVLDLKGNFYRVYSRINAQVGEELAVAGYKFNKARKLLLSLAAVFLLTVLSALSWPLWQPPVVVATISVDINPSLELSLDKEKRIINVTAKNDDALKLLQGFNFKGQTLTQTLNQLVTRAVELNFLNEERKLIVLGFSQGFEEILEPEETLGLEETPEAGVTVGPEVPEEENNSQGDITDAGSQALLSGLNEVAAAKNLDLEVVVFKLDSREGSEAQKTGLSLGEYALWETAEKAGLQVTKQTVKDSRERSQLLEVPAVQKQLKANLHVLKPQKPAETARQKTLKASRSQELPVLKANPLAKQSKQKDLKASRFKDLPVLKSKKSPERSKQKSGEASRSRKGKR
jgi:hypothetical protein